MCLRRAARRAGGDDGGSEDDDDSEEYSKEKASSSPKPSSSSPKPSSSSPNFLLRRTVIDRRVGRVGGSVRPRVVRVETRGVPGRSHVQRGENSARIRRAVLARGSVGRRVRGRVFARALDPRLPPKPTGPCADAAVARRTKAVVTFFACGDLADALTREMSREEVLERALAQLDEMFGEHAGEPAPSRARLVDWRFHDQASAPHVGGAYTHPERRRGGGGEKLAASEWGGRSCSRGRRRARG